MRLPKKKKREKNKHKKRNKLHCTMMNLHGIKNFSVGIYFIILILDPPYARDPDVPTSPMNFPRGWGLSPNVPYVHFPSPLI